jgi:PPOX class probable F420-dependent enzyme
VRRDAGLDPTALPAEALGFLAERHLATLTTLRRDGSPHVVPVGFTWDDQAGVARVITSRGARKARNALSGCRAVLCQVEGWKWLALEGPARVVDAPEAVVDAERRYAQRYRRPRPNPERVVLEVAVDRVLGLVHEPVRRPR